MGHPSLVRGQEAAIGSPWAHLNPSRKYRIPAYFAGYPSALLLVCKAGGAAYGGGCAVPVFLSREVRGIDIGVPRHLGNRCGRPQPG